MSTLIKPFRGLRPVPARCADVAAPPYDVLNTEEARSRAEGRPASFLHISKPEIDLPDGTDPHADQVYAKGAENLQTLITDGVLIRDDVPCYYAYRLRMGEHLQTGLVGVCNIDDYNSNRIRKHEFTQPSKEDDRVRQITALNAQTGPVLLAYRRSSAVKSILEKVTSGTPLYDLVADDGIGHTVWSIDAQNDIDTLTIDPLPHQGLRKPAMLKIRIKPAMSHITIFSASLSRMMKRKYSTITVSSRI
jgi:uncharacterized protein (DUF1015 family)